MMQSKIALTGGIGSGKSTVSKILREAGYTVISCDEVYSELICGELKDKISAEFDGVLNEDGSLNRTALSRRVFGDEAAVKRLNAITHPAIMQEALSRMTDKVSFCEVPLLFEGGFEKLFDKVIIVRRDKAERIKAICERSGLSEEEAKNRIAAQIDYDKLDLSKAYVLSNDGDLEKLKASTMAVLEKIINNKE